MNEPAKDESTGQEFSSRHLKECLTTGAEKFGWVPLQCCYWLHEERERLDSRLGYGPPVPGSLRALRPKLLSNFCKMALRVSRAARRISAQAPIPSLRRWSRMETGIPVDKVNVVLGDSALPPGPISGGSWATASVTPAVMQAAQKATQQLVLAATAASASPFVGKDVKTLEFADGGVQVKGQPGTRIATADLIRMANVKAISGQGKSQGTLGTDKKSSHSYGAQFAEVTWQPEIARLRVSRVVTVIDAGRIINPRAARNQIEGAVVMGVGMAMLEATEYDSA